METKITIIKDDFFHLALLYYLFASCNCNKEPVRKFETAVGRCALGYCKMTFISKLRKKL